MSEDRVAPGAFLGIGWSFPPRFSAGGGEVDVVSGVENVHRSLLVLLATRKGERPMQETYGCNLDEALFEPMGQSVVNRITGLITEAVRLHEPRVKLMNVDVSRSKTDAAALEVRVTYLILGVNSRYNMVFPFYLNEATTPIS